MSESLQLSIDLATSLSIIFAAGAFIYQQWKESYEKKELGLWQEIKEVIDTQADTMLESVRILIQIVQFDYNAIQAGQEENSIALDSPLESQFTDFITILFTIKYRVQLDSKPKIEALLIRQDTYEAKKNKLDEIFFAFNNDCDNLIQKMLIMRTNLSEMGDRTTVFDTLLRSVVGYAFMTPEAKADHMAELDTEFFNLHTLFENFSEALLGLAHNK